MKRLSSFLLAVLLVLSLCACSSEPEAAEDSAPPAGDEGETDLPADTDPDSTGGTEDQPDFESSASIYDAEVNGYEGTGWESVFENETGSITIVNVEPEFFEFIADLEKFGGSGYLSALAVILDGEAVYTEENFELSFTLDGDSLTITEYGYNPYTEGNQTFAGTYQRTDIDPGSVVKKEGTAIAGLPDMVREILVDGEYVGLYMDPAGRFTATFPDIFSNAPADEQPENGVCLVTHNKRAKFILSVDSAEGQTAMDVGEMLMGQYVGGTLEERADGMVVFTWSYDDGYGIQWTEMIFIRVLGSERITMNYLYRTENESEYLEYADRIAVSVG